MKHFAVVIPCNTHWAPFFIRYQKLIAENSHSYDLIIWNREEMKESPKYKEGLVNLIEFKEPDICNDGSIRKVPNFFRFARFVRRILSENKYDGVFFLTTAAGVVALNADYLSKNYCGRYWIDVRDSSYEWFFPYYSLLKKVVKHAFAVSISSKNYQTFLPDKDYIISHNIDPNLETYRKTLITHPSDIIRISYIGNIAYFKENKKLIDGLIHDSRFQLQYYGANTDLIKKYCVLLGVENVDFHDSFPYEQTGQFYEKTDIVNNVYGNKTAGLKTAVSNKLYYAMALGKAIITSPQTYTAELANTYGFGFTIDFNDEKWPDKLYDWYQSFRENNRETRAEELWQLCLKENTNFDNKVMGFMNSVCK